MSLTLVSWTTCLDLPVQLTLIFFKKRCWRHQNQALKAQNWWSRLSESYISFCIQTYYDSHINKILYWVNRTPGDASLFTKYLYLKVVQHSKRPPIRLKISAPRAVHFSKPSCTSARIHQLHAISVTYTIPWSSGLSLFLQIFVLQGEINW